MVSTIYVEKEVKDHPRVKRICDRFPKSHIISCERYSEVFNPHSQNFRLQKQNPALILARKREGYVMTAPAAYNIGGRNNFYFSHMLNCIYDCRYCFLQGMFNSAHYLLFVNYEDFTAAIESKLTDDDDDDPSWFFSGYDCDSLAYEPVTQFAAHFLPFFDRHPTANLELRTKSTQIRPLLNHDPMSNVVVAFSFTPQSIATALEHKVPAVELRLKSIRRLQQSGWNIGLRFDPLIYVDDYKARYTELIDRIFTSIDPLHVHSVSLGSFRMPRDYFKSIVRLYPDEPLYAGPLAPDNDGMIAYTDEIKHEMLEYVAALLLKWVAKTKLFDHEQASGATR